MNWNIQRKYKKIEQFYFRILIVPVTYFSNPFVTVSHSRPIIATLLNLLRWNCVDQSATLRSDFEIRASDHPVHTQTVNWILRTLLFDKGHYVSRKRKSNLFIYFFFGGYYSRTYFQETIDFNRREWETSAQNLALKRQKRTKNNCKSFFKRIKSFIRTVTNLLGKNTASNKEEILTLKTNQPIPLLMQIKSN